MNADHFWVALILSMVLLIIGSYFLWVVAGKSFARDVRPKRVVTVVAPVAAVVVIRFVDEPVRSGALLGIVLGTVIGYELFSFICHEEGLGVTKWLKNLCRPDNSSYASYNTKSEQEAERRRDTPPSPSSHSR